MPFFSARIRITGQIENPVIVISVPSSRDFSVLVKLKTPPISTKFANSRVELIKVALDFSIEMQNCQILKRHAFY